MTVKSSVTGLLLAGCLSVCVTSAGAVEILGVVNEPMLLAYGQDLLQANQLNNILAQLAAARETQVNAQEAREELDYQKKRMAKTDECNIAELAKYFENAPEVWAKLKQSFADKSKEMTLDFNASVPVNPNGSDEQALAEALSSWRLGRDILLDLYANPEQYGTLKAGASFPLWKDQQFLYDKQRAESYAQINAYFGAAADKAPVVAQPYNRANAAEIQQAHDAYLADLIQQNPAKAETMPDTFKTALLPPKALPPADEIVQYVGDVSQTHQAYPEWPEPWQEFIKSGFDTYNLSGEMAADFVPKTFNLNEDATLGARAGRDNRLNQYQTIQISLNAAQKILETQEQTQKEMTDYVVGRLGLYDVKPESVDWTDDAAYEQVVNQIKSLKQQKLDAIKAKVAQYPDDGIDWENDRTRLLANMHPKGQRVVLKSLQRGSDEYKKANDIIRASKVRKDMALVEALEKDANGVVPLSQFNAAQTEQLIKEHEAQEALAAEMKKEQIKNRDRFRQREMDLACPFNETAGAQ